MELSVAACSPVVPPAIFKFRQVPVFCQVQHSDIDDVLQSGSFCRCYSVSFRIQIFPDLSEKKGNNYCIGFLVCFFPEDLTDCTIAMLEQRNHLP